MFDDEEEDYDSNFQEDLELFERSLKGEPLGFIDADRLESIIDHYLTNGAYSKAASCAEFGMNRFPFSALFVLRKAQAISASGQLKEALGLLSQYERMEAPGMEFFLTKAAIFSQLKDSKRAIRYFRDALNLSDAEDRDEIYLDLAMEYQSLNDMTSSIQILNEAIRANPANEGAIYELAWCYDQVNDIEKAIKCYSDFIDENPYSFTAWYNLGNAYSKLDLFEKAVWAYDYCILINEEFSPAWFNLGNAFLSMEKYQIAIEHFEKCMEMDGEDGLALCYVGECYEQLGDYELAKHYYHRSIEFLPELPEAWLGLGIVLDLEEKTLEGIELIKKAITLDPDNGSFYHVLAGAWEKAEEPEEARTAYLVALELDPSNEEILTDYMEFLIEEESHIEALEYVQHKTFGELSAVVITLIEVNLLWLLNRQEEAISKLIFCISEDQEQAKRIFSLYPDLQNESKLVNLFSN